MVMVDLVGWAKGGKREGMYVIGRRVARVVST